MDIALARKMKLYQLTVIFSVVFALVGFSYNVWRLELSERNNTIRMASFELLRELAALEQLIYIAHYDQDLVAGSPRKGWVRVGLVSDLAQITSPEVAASTAILKQEWARGWEQIGTDRDTVNTIVTVIDESRSDIRQLLISLN